ncbi:hypothetical protein TNCV_4578471 [Trichonephila clavipes]|nr:hypothetical protein TNCV_4578471 [Trichonephila clavipes]
MVCLSTLSFRVRYRTAYSGPTPRVRVWGAVSYPICYELRQDNAHPHVAKTVRDFCSSQHMQLFTWAAYSQDKSSIEHVWDLVDPRSCCDPLHASSKYELLLRVQAV